MFRGYKSFCFAIAKWRKSMTRIESSNQFSNDSTSNSTPDWITKAAQTPYSFQQQSSEKSLTDLRSNDDSSNNWAAQEVALQCAQLQPGGDTNGKGAEKAGGKPGGDVTGKASEKTGDKQTVSPEQKSEEKAGDKKAENTGEKQSANAGDQPADKKDSASKLMPADMKDQVKTEIKQNDGSVSTQIDGKLADGTKVQLITHKDGAETLSKEINGKMAVVEQLDAKIPQAESWVQERRKFEYGPATKPGQLPAVTKMHTMDADGKKVSHTFEIGKRGYTDSTISSIEANGAGYTVKHKSGVVNTFNSHGSSSEDDPRRKSSHTDRYLTKPEKSPDGKETLEPGSSVKHFKLDFGEGKEVHPAKGDKRSSMIYVKNDKGDFEKVSEFYRKPQDYSMTIYDQPGGKGRNHTEKNVIGWDSSPKGVTLYREEKGQQGIMTPYLQLNMEGGKIKSTGKPDDRSP